MEIYMIKFILLITIVTVIYTTIVSFIPNKYRNYRIRKIDSGYLCERSGLIFKNRYSPSKYITGISKHNGDIFTTTAYAIFDTENEAKEYINRQKNNISISSL